jgi:hypothetical protein
MTGAGLCSMRRELVVTILRDHYAHAHGGRRVAPSGYFS